MTHEHDVIDATADDGISIAIDFGNGVIGTATGLTFEDALPYPAWDALVKRLTLSARASPWWVGDCFNHGEGVYGESYAQAVDEFGLEPGTIANYVSVAKRWPQSSRIRYPGLPWGYWQAAAVLDDEQAEELLSQAAEGREGPDADEWRLVSFRARVKHAKSGFSPNGRGYTDEEPSPEEQARLAQGDRVEQALLEDSPWEPGQVDLLLTSPPYGVGIPYSGGGDVENWAEYLDMVGQWAEAIKRLLNPRHGRAAINVPIDRSDNAGRRGRPSYTGRPIYAAWTNALVDVGLDYRSTILWHDGQAGEGTQRGSVDSPAAPHVVAPCEAVILVYAGTWSRSSERAHDLSHQSWLDDLGPRGLWLWDITGEADHTEHPAPWPRELPERLIRLLSFRGDIIADPMCGRGTAGVVGARLGRKVWLADRSSEYVAIARQALIEARGGVEEAVA